MYAGHEGGAYAKNSFGNMYAYYIFLISIFVCVYFYFEIYPIFIRINYSGPGTFNAPDPTHSVIAFFDSMSWSFFLVEKGFYVLI